METTQPLIAGIAPSKLTDDETHALTRGIRIAVISDLVKEGRMPAENSDRILLTNMLNGLDAQANASKRIQLDNKAVSNTAAIIAAVLDGVNKNKVFQKDVIDVEATPVDESRIMIGNSIPTPTIVPGELDVEAPQMDYSTFLRSQGLDEDALGSAAEQPKEEDEY